MILNLNVLFKKKCVITDVSPKERSCSREMGTHKHMKRYGLILLTSALLLLYLGGQSLPDLSGTTLPPPRPIFGQRSKFFFMFDHSCLTFVIRLESKTLEVQFEISNAT